MELDKLKPSDICKIIKECAQSGVSIFEMGDLYLRFGSPTANCEDETSPSQPAVGSFPEVTPEKTDEIIDISNVQDRSERLNEEIQELMITDPEEYERLMAQGELEDAEEKDLGSDADADRLGSVG